VGGKGKKTTKYLQAVREIRGVCPVEEKEGCDGKDLQKRKVLSVE